MSDSLMKSYSKMNWKSILAAVVVALSPMAATAVTVNINADGETCSTETGIFFGTCNNIAFSVSAAARDGHLLGRLESTVFVTELYELATVTVEIIQEGYEDLRPDTFANILSYAEVGDIVGIEPVLNPVRGGVEVAHFIQFDGEPEMTLADFAFGGLTGEREEVDTIQNLGPYRLRSLFTFEADRRGAASVLGDIVVRPSDSPAPTPLPRPPSSFGSATSIPTMPLYALIVSVIGLLLVGVRRLKYK